MGHGGSCLAVGGHVVTLSSVYFRCSGGGPLTDMAGPFGNMFAGGAAWLLLHRRVHVAPTCWLLVLLSMALNWFWAAGYLVFSGLTDVGDWAFAAHDIVGRGVWQWRPVAVLLGLVCYAATFRLTRRAIGATGLGAEPQASRRHRMIRTAYAAAAISACLAAALFVPRPGFSGTPFDATRQAVQEIGIASAGLWFVGRRSLAVPSPATPLAAIGRSWIWIVTGILVFFAFAATMGRGVL
jgi:hypothetical protein